jgi:hypothetical protein
MHSALGAPVKINNIHIPISLLCYLACLALPGYYIGERFEPQMAYAALMIGWLGPLDGHFSWYANPLFLLALLYANRPQRSSVLGFIALALAISFLFHKKIIVSEAPTYKTIMSYGWGYGLWVTSLAVFSIGQLLRALGAEGRQITIASFSSCSLLLAGYTTYYFAGDNSLFSIRTERNQEFQKRCASSGERIFKRTNDVRGIFFDPDWQWEIFFNRDKPSFKYIGGAGVLGLGHLNSGHLLFYETRDRKDPSSYVKYVLGDHKGIPIDRLESEYAVITNHYEIPARLNISGATVTIKDLRDNSIVATSTFFVENESGKFCGNPRGHFSTSIFMTEVLNLTRKYPTAFK